ncbi:MAG: PAS domain S-box protein [Polyangiaceae bacterium]|jgi:PAS domain S-box-containing protein|nr:PAS domain S-box protein [Polyangiaceae bacterium]
MTGAFDEAAELSRAALAWDLLRSAELIAFVSDENGHILLCNPACERLTGVQAAQCADRVFWDDFCAPEATDDVAALVHQLAHGGAPITRDHPWINASGASVLLRWTYSHLRSSQGPRLAAVGVDVTVERRQSGELEQRLHALFEDNPAPCVVLGLDLTIRDVNRAVVETFGWTREQLMGCELSRFVMPEHRSCMRALIGNASERLLPQACELGILCSDGTVHTILFSPGHTPVYQGARAVGILLVGTDIHDRRMAEEAARRSEARSRAILQLVPDLMFRLRTDGTLLDFYASDERLLHAPALRIVGGHLQDLVPSQVAEASIRCAQRALDTGKVATHEYSLDVPAGHLFFEARHIATGEPDEVLAIVRDITERRRTEQALRDSEHSYRMLMERASDGILVMDGAGKILSANRRACEMLGYDHSEFLSTSLGEMCADSEHHRLQDRYRELRHGATLLLDLPLRCQDGAWLDVEISATGLPNGTLQGILRDVTERRRAEAALRRSEESFRTLIDRSPSMIAVLRHRRIVYVNQTAVHALGYDEPQQLIGTSALALLHPDDRDDATTGLEHQHRPGEAQPVRERRLLRRDGTFRWAEVASFQLEFQGEMAGILIANDITERKLADAERKKLEANIVQSQKLESLGVLAGGVAHDFNNLLLGVLGNAELALTELPLRSPAHHHIKRVEAAALRAADLTKQLLAYSGRGRFIVQPVDVRQVAKEVISLLETAISKKATLRLDFAPDLPKVDADPCQIRQLLMNLITNASDALDDREGTITLKIGVIAADQQFFTECFLHDKPAERMNVLVEVSDTGCGIPPDASSRIFDPFFSTKFTGRGLGLPAVLGIVRGHRGAIKVESEPGRGTCVRVLFPTASPSVTPACPSDRAAEPSLSAGMILVVDDEDMVRSVSQAVLVKHGFQVVTACDGLEAVEMVRARGHEVVLVLLDMTMPRMSGEEAFREIRRLQPSLPIVLTSGYSEQEMLGRFAAEGGARFLQKPYIPAALIAKVREALGT